MKFSARRRRISSETEKNISASFRDDVRSSHELGACSFSFLHFHPEGHQILQNLIEATSGPFRRVA